MMDDGWWIVYDDDEDSDDDDVNAVMHDAAILMIDFRRFELG